MYSSIRLPWSKTPSSREVLYHSAGLIKTKGTLFLIPPSTEVLRESFNTPPRPKSRMSSGAIALCKHFERGGSSSERGLIHPFWPLPTGSNENKTKLAAEILELMLKDVKWKNVMLLHHGVAVYEIRNSLGYGMRWTLELRKIEGETYKEMSVSETAEGEDQTKWSISQISFRGLLEPIEGLNDELLDGFMDRHQKTVEIVEV